MPLTLEQSKVGLADYVDQQVIDEFRRDSFILDRLTFDNAVSPGTGGSTLTYGYLQLKTPSVAEGRKLNSDKLKNLRWSLRSRPCIRRYSSKLRNCIPISSENHCSKEQIPL